MAYKRLIKTGRIKAYNASEQEIRSLLEIAMRDLETAERTISIDTDWAYNISYNAMLQASRALMLRVGFRPRGSAQHATVVQFVKEAIGKEHRKYVAFFDQMRRKRHRTVYETTKLIGEREAKQALVLAHDFVQLLTGLILQE
jgi:uncharacterized protein (UPF0332 family)